MANEKTIRRIMDAVGIKPKQIGLTEKILELESDNKRIHSVELHHGTMPCLNLWAEVNLRGNFEDLSEFKDYLASRGLPQEEISITLDKRTYILENEGVRVEFKKPEVYSHK